MPTFHKDDGPWTTLTDETEDFYVFLDGYPVTPGHTLIVPKVDSAFIIGICFEHAVKMGKRLVETKVADGFNVGLNYGVAAGQTIMWPHIHLIPRRVGDMDNPIGGVRHVIPSQGNYKSDTYVEAQ